MLYYLHGANEQDGELRETMNTYRTQSRSADWASQSRVVHDRRVLDGVHNRFSVQLMRRRSCHRGVEKRGWNLFVSIGRLRGEIGTR